MSSGFPNGCKKRRKFYSNKVSPDFTELTCGALRWIASGDNQRTRNVTEAAI
jgi:hypothetical protein